MTKKNSKLIRLNNGEWVTLKYYIILRKTINKITKQIKTPQK